MVSRLFSCKKLIFATGLLLVLLLGAVVDHPVSAVSEGSKEIPFQLAESYLKAIQARDFATAYSYISDVDRGVRDKANYLRSQENLSGFALELSKRLTANMKVWAIHQKLSPDKAHFDLGYRVPTGDEISAQLFDWNATKLNSLSWSDQRQILKTLEDLGKSGRMITLQGYESLDLVRQKDGWRIFLDWPSRSRVIFKSIQPASRELEVDFLRNDFLVAVNEPFQIDFTVKNKSPHALVARLNHLIEPRRLAKNLEMIACGSLLPLQLRAGEIREISSSYILGGSLAPKTQVSIIYQFTLEPGTTTRATFQSSKANLPYSDDK